MSGTVVVRHQVVRSLRPVQSPGTGIQARRQKHRLAHSGVGLLEEELVETPCEASPAC